MKRYVLTSGRCGSTLGHKKILYWLCDEHQVLRIMEDSLPEPSDFTPTDVEVKVLRGVMREVPEGEELVLPTE